MEKKNFLSTQIKSFSRKITTHFYDNKEKGKTSKIVSSGFCVLDIVLDSVDRMENDDDDGDDDDD